MVKCSECGFLSFRERGSLQLVEADQVIRAETYIPNAVIFQRPYCFIRKIDFAEQYGWDKRDLDVGDTEVFPAIREERDCDGFTPWMQGFSPKEHVEMLERERRIRFEEDMRRQAWEREERRDAEMRRREDERDTKVQELQKQLHNRELIIIGGAVTIALVLGSLGAAIIEGAVSSGWEPSWWPF